MSLNWTFDWNEWFLIITSFILFFIFLKIRKHFQPIIIIIIWIYSVAFTETIDYFLAATPFKVYYCGDNFTYEPIASLLHIFIYPAFSFIFLFFYEKRNFHGIRLFNYILIWNVFSIFFEWINIKNEVITYSGWNIFYSIPTYPISSLFLIKIFHFVKIQINKPMLNKES